MIVCSCKGVSHRVIEKAIEGGATTVDQVGEACGAGTRCGTCRGHVHDLIEAAGAGCSSRGGSCPDCPRALQLAS